MSLAVTLQAVDQAIYNLYSGVLLNGATVPVFIEEPDPSIVPERVFPSVSIMMLSEIVNLDLLESDRDVGEEVGLDTTDPLKPILTMRSFPEPYILTYAIDTWNKRDPSDQRDLLQLILNAKTRISNKLECLNIDGDPVYLDMFATSATVPRNERNTDEIIYHTSKMVEVWAWIDLSVPPTQEKAVGQTQINVRGYKNEVNDPFPPTDPEENLDIQIRITDSGVEVI